jgi:hypothetical protein
MGEGRDVPLLGRAAGELAPAQLWDKAERRISSPED